MHDQLDTKPMNYKPQLKRVLVVISPDLVKPGAPKESALVTRALALAKATGCELEFFHVCHDDSFTSGFFSYDDEVRREQENLVDQDATLMAELVARLSVEGVTITHSTRWDSPRTEAILRKINDAQPDLVMKQSREHGYVMGLLGNTDWDLIRRSPAHLWFVNHEGVGSIDSLVTAVGSSTNEVEILAAADYDVFRLSNLIAEGFNAINTPVHAYQAPVGNSNYAAYAPEFGGSPYPRVSSIPTPEEMRQKIARKHGQCIESFAEYFHIETSRILIREGHPSDVLNAAASDVKASLIVMAARNLSRWERFSHFVTAEPLLADAPCDVLFVKDVLFGKDVRAALDLDAKVPPLEGVAAYDFEKAIMDPARAFRSPETLARASEISAPFRNRILEIWEQDIRAQMAAEDDGGPVGVTHADLLESIANARTLLREEPDEFFDATAALSH